jgi:hypothetical protein
VTVVSWSSRVSSELDVSFSLFCSI